jgi:outer membrane protein assembly factor BamD (BamD/ComL family)
MLGQEREALTIEAMAQAGQHRAALQRADQFLRAYPWSPHADRVRQAVTR